MDKESRKAESWCWPHCVCVCGGGVHYSDYEDDFMGAHVSKHIRVHFELGKDNSQSS